MKPKRQQRNRKSGDGTLLEGKGKGRRNFYQKNCDVSARKRADLENVPRGKLLKKKRKAKEERMKKYRKRGTVCPASVTENEV